MTVCQRLGNCNNGLNDGLSARNWNDEAGRSNWNNGAALILSRWMSNLNAGSNPTPLTVVIPLIRHYWLGEWKLSHYGGNEVTGG